MRLFCTYAVQYRYLKKCSNNGKGMRWAKMSTNRMPMTPQKIMSNIIPTLTPKHLLTIFQLSVKASTFTFPKPISRIRAHFVDNNVKLDKTSPKHGTVRYSTVLTKHS